ncbi:MAG: hypothetical protein V3V98_03390 [Thermoplasmata archaeon]
MAEALAFKEAESIVRSVLQYKKLLEPFRPDLRNLRLDYRTGEAEMVMHLYVPTSGRSGKKVLVPDSAGLSIVDMYDGLITRVDHSWKRTKRGLSLSARNLPKGSEHFILRATGEIPLRGLQHFIETNKSTDCFDLRGEDVYWISCALTDIGIEAWKKIYKELMVQNVTVSVRVGVKACFTTTIPHKLRVVLEARRELILAMSSGNRNRIRKAKYRVDSLKRMSSASEEDVVKEIGGMLARPVFRNYVYATKPFKIGDLQGDELRMSAIPDTMTVEAFADLGYRQKKATGNIHFKREKYKRDVRRRMKKLLA